MAYSSRKKNEFDKLQAGEGVTFHCLKWKYKKISIKFRKNGIPPRLKNFVKSAMFCHLAVLIHHSPLQRQGKRPKVNKKESKKFFNLDHQR